MNAQVLKTRRWLLLAYLLAAVISGCKNENTCLSEIDRNSVATAWAEDRGTWPSAIWRTETATFADPTFGLVIDVPSDWLIQPRLQDPTNSNLVNTLSSPCLVAAPHVLPPCTKIQLSLGPSSVRSVEEMEELSKNNIQSSPSSTILEKHSLDLHGLPALWLKIENTGISEFHTVHVEILVGQQVVYLNAYGELGPVADIVNSIRPIK